MCGVQKTDHNVLGSVSELRSLESVLEDPYAKAYFRLFLNSQFNGENLLFLEEVRACVCVCVAFSLSKFSKEEK